MKHPIVTTRNGIPVYIDLVRSQAAGQIARQPRLLTLAKEALQGATVSGSEPNIEQDMGRVIGHSFVVETTEKDTVIYAQCLNDKTFSRFVKHGRPSPTNYLTILLKQDGDSYELHDTWIGRLRPPDQAATMKPLKAGNIGLNTPLSWTASPYNYVL